MVLREEDVLEPKDLLANPDHWPNFNLQKISVTSQNTGKEVSLLSAHRGNPVKVTGKLETIDEGLLHLVRDKRYRDKTVELIDVTVYAFAEFEDGTHGFWAAGKAGWFEIQSPASAFSPVYNKMVEAASIFYMLADKLKRTWHSHPKLSKRSVIKYASQTFQDYLIQRKASLGAADVDDIRECFHEHRDFLITSMLEGQDGLNWRQTPMETYFKLMFPEDYTAIEARVLGIKPANSRDSSRKRKSPAPHMEGKVKRRRGRRPAREPEDQCPETPPKQNENSNMSSDEGENSNPNVISRNRKSILQPSGGKFSHKAASRRKGLAEARGLDGKEQSDDQDDDNHERQKNGESPITTIRKAKDLELLANPPGDASPEALPSPTLLPRKYLELQVVEYSLPSVEPQGPGDLWTCTFENCFHRVYEASTQLGKTKIKDHIQGHASQAQEKIDLVLNESRPYLPVNNLVRRLQAFAPIPGEEPSLDSLGFSCSAPIRESY